MLDSDDLLRLIVHGLVHGPETAGPELLEQRILAGRVGARNGIWFRRALRVARRARRGLGELSVLWSVAMVRRARLSQQSGAGDDALHAGRCAFRGWVRSKRANAGDIIPDFDTLVGNPA